MVDRETRTHLYVWSLDFLGETHGPEAVPRADVRHHVRHARDRARVRRGRRRVVWMVARRGRRETERRDLPPAGERAHPRPPSARGSGREREIRGRGHAPPKGRRCLPRAAHGPPGVPGRKADRFHGDDASLGTAATSVRHGSEALSMAAPPFESRTWVQALRAPFLVASLIPGFVGALAARQAGYGINLGLLGLSLLGLGFIHLGTNMTNDAWDYRSGNDLEVRHLNPFAGGGRVLFRGVLNLRTHLAVAVTFLLLGSLIGLYLVSIVGLPLLWLGLVGVAAAYFYVAPPLRLAHRGIGEVAGGLAFRPVTVLGGYYVLARAFDPPAVILSISLGLLVAGILWINEIPDIPADAAVGKRTLVVRLGVARATTAFGAIGLPAYAILVVGVVLFSLTPWALLALLAVPLAIKPILGLRRAGGRPPRLVSPQPGVILATVVTGILLLAGLAIETLV